MNQGFFLAKDRLGLGQSLRAYWLYLTPFLLQPFIYLACVAVAPSMAGLVGGVYFIASAVFAMWPLAFKDASAKFWAAGCLGWFILHVLAQLGAALVS